MNDEHLRISAVKSRAPRQRHRLPRAPAHAQTGRSVGDSCTTNNTRCHVSITDTQYNKQHQMSRVYYRYSVQQTTPDGMSRVYYRYSVQQTTSDVTCLLQILSTTNITRWHVSITDTQYNKQHQMSRVYYRYSVQQTTSNITCSLLTFSRKNNIRYHIVVKDIYFQLLSTLYLIRLFYF